MLLLSRSFAAYPEFLDWVANDSEVRFRPLVISLLSDHDPADAFQHTIGGILWETRQDA